MKYLFGLIVLMHCLFGNVVGQEEKTPKLGIINGRATYLPKPEYPPEAKDFCAGGKVEIEVLVSEKGDVIEAKAISGDELLGEVSVESAKRAKFTTYNDAGPVKTKGIIVYNFPSVKRCINAGIVNKKALSLPKPYINPDIKIKEETIVKVGVIIDESGKVVFAKVLTNIHPLLRAAFENTARKAKFYPTNDVGRILVKAYIVYKLKPNGKVET